VKTAEPAKDVKTAVAEKVVKKVEKKEAEKEAVKKAVEKKEEKTSDPIAAATKAANKVAKAKNPVDLVKKVTKAVTPKPEKKVTKPVVEKKPAPANEKQTLADMVGDLQGGAANKPKIVGDKGRKHIHHRHSMSKTGYAPNTERNFAAEALESLRLSTGRENSSTEPIVIENQQGKPIASSNTA